MERRPFPAQVQRLGEYFTLAEPRGTGWRTIAELLDEVTLTGLVAETRRAMAIYAHVESSAVPERAAASSVQLSIAARLLSPVVGCFATGNGVPLLTDDALRWRQDGHSVHFGVNDPDWVDTRSGAVAAAALDSSVIATVLAPVLNRMQAATALSPTVMWGNLTSAAHGAVAVIRLSDSELASTGMALIHAMLGLPRLQGTATLAGAGFRRRSCCLYYLAPNGGLCGDCVLHEPKASH